MASRLFQLTLVPASFYGSHTKDAVPICVECHEVIEQVDEFKEEVLPGGSTDGFYYDGKLSTCPNCGHAHYVVDHTNIIKGPVTVEWEN